MNNYKSANFNTYHGNAMIAGEGCGFSRRGEHDVTIIICDPFWENQPKRENKNN